jgi:hypothetical protein
MFQHDPAPDWVRLELRIMRAQNPARFVRP